MTMARRNTGGAVLGVILAALCFSAAVFLFQASASAGESALFINAAPSAAR
jgi:hypothetical protein